MSKVTTPGEVFGKLLPEGKVALDIVKEPELQEMRGNPYKWFFKVADSGQEFTPLIVQFGQYPMQDLLVALGFTKNEEGNYDWDTEAVVGKRIECEIVHEEITTKKGKKTVERIKNIKEI